MSRLPLPPALLTLTRAALVAAAYFLAARLSLSLGLGTTYANAFWPAAGIALGAVLVYGYRMAPGVALGIALVWIHLDAAPAVLAVAVAGSTGAAVAGAALLRGWIGMSTGLDRPRDVLALIAVGALVSPAIAATVSTAAIALSGIAPPADFKSLWALWWSGDALGVLLVTPLFLAWTGAGGPATRPQGAALLMTAAQLAVCALVFLAPLPLLKTGAAPYLTIPLALLIALHADLRWVSGLNLASALLAALGTRLGWASFDAASPGGLLEFQTYCMAVAGSTLLIASLGVERTRIERELSASLERFRRLTAVSADWYWEQDKDLRFTFVSSGVLERAGVQVNRVVRLTRFEVPYIWESEDQKRKHAEDLAARRPFSDLVLQRRNDTTGEKRWLSISGEPVHDAAGEFAGYRGVGHDITERKRAEDALRASEERFRSLVEMSQDWYWEQDEGLRFTALSEQYAERTSLRAEDAIGKTRFEIPNLWLSELQRKEHEAVLGARKPFRDLELRRHTPGGELRYVSISGAPVFDADGRFRGYRGVGRDITAQKLAQRALEASEARFRSLLNLSADWLWEQDENFRFTWFSGDVREKSGTAPAGGIGKTRFELPAQFESEDHRRQHELDLQAHRTFRDLRLRRVGENGEPRYSSISGEPVYDEEGRFTGYRGVGHDITPIVQAGEAVRNSEARFRSLVELTSDWYWEQDEDFRFTLVTGAPGNSLLDHFQPVLGRARWEFSFENMTDAAWRAHRALLEAHQSFRDLQLAFRARDGALCWVSVSGEPVFDASGRFRGYRGTTRDITAMMRAQDAVRESEMRFRSLVELSSDWYWEQDEEFRFTMITGAQNKAILAEFEGYIGKTRWELPYQNMTDADWRAHRGILEAHKSYRDLELAYRDAGGRLGWLSVSGEPWFDPKGEFRGYRGTTRDISPRKHAEQRIARLSDLYATFSDANHAVIHARDPQELFQDVCRIAVERGHFLFARVALIDFDTGEVNNVATAGDDKGIAAQLRFSINPDVPHGRGPGAIALRAGQSFVCNDLTIEAAGRPFLEIMREAGVKSDALFPLRRGGKPVGAIRLYAGQVGFFDADLVALLEKLALNISFALDNFERERARAGAEAALRESEVRFRDFADAAGEYVWETDLEGHLTYVSSRVQSVWGYSDQELIGRLPHDFMPPGEAERVREWVSHNMQPDGSFRDLEHMVTSKSGETRWLRINAVAMLDAQGRRTGFRGTGRDITDRKNADARISYLATRDPLTELPNRVLFNDRLEQGLLGARRTGQSLALMFIDLDRFKNINDSLGHQVGDLLLKEVSLRMQGCIRKGDTLSRLGGDEFVVTLEGLDHAEDAAQVATKIIRALARPFDIANHTLNTSCSIGISIFPNDADDERTLMKNADTAMYHAKEKGRNNYQFFAPEMNVRAVERHNLETALRLALDRGEFLLYYQPQVDIRSGRVIGMEALLRWQHPDRGLLSPAGFIAVAEESGLIEPIGQWVLKTACERAKAWQEAGYPALKMAVNISARQLLKARDFSRTVSRVLSETGLDPRYLELEMTESLLVQNVDDNISALRKLGDEGVRIAVDDFGTGYSSLAYLRQLPIDTIKIDRSFVRDLEHDPEDVAIIEAIIAMAHSLRMQVTAEGVETRGQLESLVHLGCDEYQGYLFSRPLPAVDVAARFLAPGELDLTVSG